MPSPDSIPRKWKLHAHGKHNVFAWGMDERAVHVVMKALIWALYLPDYPDLRVEVRIGDRYKPDVVQTDDQNVPQFWGEAGMVSRSKISSLARRYKNTHLVIGKWDTKLDPLVGIVEDLTKDVRRTAPFDLIRFPADSIERFIDEEGNITITFDDVELQRLDDRFD